ncbi:MAG TPA: PilZ domain-containing protein [Candidatus Methylomirabilis sp.]|nr:PilZ domain-containing protein [Candidatus Methylomirabilis sp.]
MMNSSLMVNETIRSDGLRQSDRVRFRMPVEVSWPGSDGTTIRKVAETMLVSRNGGVLRLDEKLSAGQDIAIRRMEGDIVRTTRARVVTEIDQEPDGFLYAVHITDRGADFWDIDFPAPDKAEEALARLLMECGFCQRREVVYLNELELKSFEVRKCVARHCKHCDTPSIWVEAQSELKAPEPNATRPEPIEERVIPRRNRTRVKARVLACIRRRGFQEEVAVCEDLSKGGLSFRSRNQYEEGTRVEVAVPYTPGSGAIFVPIRIVFSQAIPSVGLFRHGAAYIRGPLEPTD